jgi:hypothetical protein
MKRTSKVKETADKIVDLTHEAEAASHAAVDAASLAQARVVLGRWLDEVKGVVVNPAFGRVTLIHKNGHASTIASFDLAFKMSAAGIS